jgi:hypothetical protein
MFLKNSFQVQHPKTTMVAVFINVAPLISLLGTWNSFPLLKNKCGYNLYSISFGFEHEVDIVQLSPKSTERSSSVF